MRQRGPIGCLETNKAPDAALLLRGLASYNSLSPPDFPDSLLAVLPEKETMSRRFAYQRTPGHLACLTLHRGAIRLPTGARRQPQVLMSYINRWIIKTIPRLIKI
jgi:hypothetical protein